MEKVYKQTGHKPKELETGELPEELLYLWSWFVELKRFTGPLTYSEIKSWCDLSNKTLSAWELETIVKLDVLNTGGPSD